MNASELEHHLALLAPRRLPETWKRGILDSVAIPPPGRSILRGVERMAWGAIAAAWVAIMVLHVTTPFIATPSGPPVSAAAIAEHWSEIRRYAAMEYIPHESPPPVRIEIDQEFVLPARPRS